MGGGGGGGGACLGRVDTCLASRERLSRITCVPESLPSELYKQSRFTSVSVNGVLHITVALHLESYILGIRH